MPYLASRIREALNDLRTRYPDCPDCGRPLRRYADYAKHGARHAYWSGKAGKAMRRKMGKERDALRRWARANLEQARLVDRFGRRTPQWRTRPELPARPKLRDFRQAERHTADHNRAAWHDTRAAAHRARAERHKARAGEKAGRARPAGRAQRRAAKHEARAAGHETRAKERRGRWAEVPSRAAPPPRVPANGTRPAPSSPPSRNGQRTPAPVGVRLAPGSRDNGHGNGTRPVPQRPRTR